MLEGPKTGRGRATRERIVVVTGELIADRGVAATSLDNVIERAGVSKGQLYHYFDDRPTLLHAVADRNADRVLGSIGPLDSWRAIRAWFDSMVEHQAARGARGGCPIGSLAAQLTEADEAARLALADAFARWETLLCKGLRSMQTHGKLAPRADPGRLATAALASIQGGLLLTQT